MNYSATVEIPRNKIKAGLMAMLSFVFIFGFYFLFRDADHVIINGARSPLAARVIGLSGMAGMALFTIVLAKQYLRTDAGLILNPEGFVDNNVRELGLVAWDDITALREVKIGASSFMAVMLRDPAKYLSRPTKSTARRLLANNERQYGSPVLLTTALLQCSDQELWDLMNARLAQSRQS